MKIYKKSQWIWICFVVNSIAMIESAKILAVFPFPGPSQYILVKPYLKTLAARGHDLTVINAYPSKENVTNYRDIPIMEAQEIQTYYMQGINIERNVWSGFTFTSDFSYNVTRSVLRSPEVQELLKLETFDLVILEACYTEAWYSFGPHFGIPIIGVSAYGSDQVINENMGNPAPYSYISTMGTGFTEEMSYVERLQNILFQLLELVHYKSIHQPRQQGLLETYMPHITESVETLRRNISLYLLNQHFTLGFPKPNVPNMIEVGGLQIPTQTKPLPADIKSIIDNSSQDIIYFSMGSNVKSKDFPPQILQTFNKVFAQLPYTILWKYENPELSGKPANVHINPWFPQTDILAEPKVKLFISHGGLLSIFETVHHGKPILGIPIFFDQNLNVNNAQKKGFAMRLDVATLNEDNLKATIIEMMTNPKYSQRVKEISQRYHDQPLRPMDLAVYWTEYIVRHQGVLFLRSPAQKMDVIRSNSLDTVGLLVVAVLIMLCLIIWSFFKICSLLFVPSSVKVKIN